MDRQKLKIKSPCSKDFDEMEGEGFKRFCDHCDKHVHNLSDLTRHEALSLLKANADSGLCVIYTFDASNKVRFKEEMGFPRPPKSQLRGLKRLLAAAAMVPVLAGLPACDSSPDTAEINILEGYQNEPCDLNRDQDRFRPIDSIIAAEREFVSKLKDLLGFTPEYEYQLAGEPAIDPEIFEQPEPEPMVMGKMAYEPEPEPEQLPEPEPEQVPVLEPMQMKMMGDMAEPSEVIEAIERDIDRDRTHEYVEF